MSNKTEKMWTHVNNWLSALPTDVHLEMFLTNSNDFNTDEDKNLYRKLWKEAKDGKTSPTVDDSLSTMPLEIEKVEPVEAIEVDEDKQYHDMNKDELETWAREIYNVELDRRKTKKNMIEDLESALLYYNYKDE